MPIKSLNTIFRGAVKADDNTAPQKRYSKDIAKRSSYQLAQHPVTAPLTPPVSPFYPGFPSRSNDPAKHVVSHSPCVTISGPLPDDVFAMIVSQQQQQQESKRTHHRYSYSLGSASDQLQPSSMLPSRSSSLAPSLTSSLNSSTCTSPSVSSPATPTTDISNPLAGRRMEKLNRQGSYAAPSPSNESHASSSRPRAARTGSTESMTDRGVSWGTKRSISDRTLRPEKRNEEDAQGYRTEARSLVGEVTEAFAAQSRAPKKPEFRLSGIPLRTAPAPGMSRSYSTGTCIRISPLTSPRGQPRQSLWPSPSTGTQNMGGTQLAKPSPPPSPPPTRNSVRSSTCEPSLLSPPLSAVGPSFGNKRNAARSSSRPSPPLKSVRESVTSSDTHTSTRDGFRRTSSSSEEQTSPEQIKRDSRRSTFGRSVVTPVNTSSPRFSSIASPRESMMHPLTPPPDMPLPPVPTTTQGSESTMLPRRFSQRPMSIRTSTPPVSLMMYGESRPALTSRHSAASRLPTLKYRKSSPELGTPENAQSTRSGGSRRRPSTPWDAHHSPELAQFGTIDYSLPSSSGLLTDEPSLFPSSSTWTTTDMPLSPSFDALGAMLDEPLQTRRKDSSGLLVDMEPPWMDSPSLATQQSLRLPSLPKAAVGRASPAPMKRTQSSGLEGIKALLAQVDDWTRIHGFANAQQNSAARATRTSLLQDPFNARAVGSAEFVGCARMAVDADLGEEGGDVVWGTAL
ncbi:hypothetical protein QFC21_006427 [Naganishia friedmannii]|uniref:Uncharacterized protein n=1 Tax=Naganishia friedmannii TaxID=89922 RepID=A0ACC2V2D1_9TREE|nr:hypothetical protein QFC21_006427 [Naganishia friedmannii]